MKKNRFLTAVVVVLVAPLIIAGCGDDEETTSTDFATIASSYDEGNGDGTVTIPFRNPKGNTSNLSVRFGGDATEGVDYELVGITQEGVQIRVINDLEYENLETVRVELLTDNRPANNNYIHELTIVSDCSDVVNLDPALFAGVYAALEDYTTSTYGPYDVTLVQDEDNPNMFHFNKFYGSPCDAFMVFNTANGTVYFPDQAPCDTDLTKSTGTYQANLCGNVIKLTIKLNFDGGDWTYRFTKK